MEIRAFVAPLLKWWWLIVAAVVIAVVASYISVRQQPDIYQSRATLLVGRAMDDPNPTGTQFTQGQQLAQFYADLARREPVRRAVMETLGLSALPDYSATALPNTQLIEIGVRDTDPVRAQAVANELAQQLVQLTPSTAEPEEEERYAFINDQLGKLQQQIEDTEAEIDAKKAELGGLFSAQEIDQAQTEIDALEAKLSALQTNYSTMLATSQEGASNTITVVEPASLPRQPVDPQTILTLLVAGTMGFALAATGAYVLEYVDNKVDSEEDVREYAGLTTLATVAPIKFEEDESHLVAHDRPRSPHAEAFRVLRMGVSFGANGSPPRSLLVTSPKQGDGKSLTVANLAIAMAQSEKRVLIIDSDFHRPTQHKLFDISHSEGLTDLLLPPFDRLQQKPLVSRLNSLIKYTNVKNVWLLPCSHTLIEPSEFPEPELMHKIVSAAQERFDVVIFDTPPCLAFTEPIELSAQVDGVVLVISAGHTTRNELKQAATRLQMSRTKLLGVVLNRLSKVDESYYYIDHYYSQDEFESDTNTHTNTNSTEQAVIDRT